MQGWAGPEGTRGPGANWQPALRTPVSGTAPRAEADAPASMDTRRRLRVGDNLGLLAEMASESVDLVYLDPPWNPKADYNVFFRDASGKRSEAQRRAFAGTWTWGPTQEDHFEYLTRTGRHHGKVPAPMSSLVSALRASLGETPILAYVVEMSVRLVDLHRVLRPTGSLYLHSDPTVSHYLKLVLDSLFERRNFRSEIIWKRTGAHNSPFLNRFGPAHDVILFYARSPKTRWQNVRAAYSDVYVASHFKKTDNRGRFQDVALTGPGIVEGGESGKPWRDHDPRAGGRHWQPASYVYTKYRELTGDDLARHPFLERLDKLDDTGLIYWTRNRVPRYRFYLADAPGVPLQDVWSDIAPINSQAHERTGWETQKPLALLERIIRASTKEDEVVLDPFCGCGTALDAAESLGRQWIGMDISWDAMAVMKARLRSGFGIEIAVDGSPVDVDAAMQLARQKPDGRDQFEAWALSLIDAVPHGGPQRKGADQGADGLITFSGASGVEMAIVSAKSGHVEASDVQKLKGAMQRHGGSMGILVTLEDPSGPMRVEAATAGKYHSPVSDLDYERVQILTIREILEQRKQPALPPLVTPQYQETFWSDLQVIPRISRRGKSAVAKRSRVRKEAEAMPESPLLERIREEYAHAASPEGPRSPRTSKRDRTVPLP
jgi:DNA modification methylase